MRETTSHVLVLPFSHSPILPFLHLQLQADVDTYGPVLAILMAIGGLDTRPRLGGLVHQEELGPGTVAKIEARSKVVVLFHGRKAIKSCNIGAVRAVSGLHGRVISEYEWPFEKCWHARSYGVMVSTLDFESSDPSSSLGRTSFSSPLLSTFLFFFTAFFLVLLLVYPFFKKPFYFWVKKTHFPFSYLYWVSEWTSFQ